MDAERLRAFLLTLPNVVETQQWGNNLVYWVGDKAIGGKMFALMNLDTLEESSPVKKQGILSFSAGPERFADLLEIEGCSPAPYFARIHWIAAEHWQVFTNTEWEDHLRNAYAIMHAKLPPRTLASLALPAAQQKRLIAERRVLLAKSKTEVKPKKSSAKKAPAKKKLSAQTHAKRP
jgi:predicted DNA-binding protein (MmcQ/YjbR family)